MLGWGYRPSLEHSPINLVKEKLNLKQDVKNDQSRKEKIF